VLNFADRQIMPILAEAVKRDLRLSDFQLGLLTGPAVALFYALAGLPLAYVADRTNRVRFMAVCIIAWSAFTAFSGVANSFLQMACARVGVAIGEAGGAPVSTSLIADYFPPQLRATAFGIFSSSSCVGLFVGMALGGLSGDAYGWRVAFSIAAAVGLIVALLQLTVREPVRGILDPGGAAALKEQGTKSLSLPKTIAHLWRIRIFRSAVLSASMANLATASVLAWSPPLTLRKFHIPAAQAGLLIGPSMAVLGGIAIVYGGVITDRLAKRGNRSPLRLVAIVQAAAAPLLLTALFIDDLYVFVALLAMCFSAIVFYAGSIWSVIHNHTPPSMRASAGSVMLLAMTLIGSGLGPPLIGGLADLMRPRFGSNGLQFALIAVAAANIIGATLFMRTARFIERHSACAP
jgi:predicted MFS family arabinose efflux permease